MVRETLQVKKKMDKNGSLCNQHGPRFVTECLAFGLRLPYIVERIAARDLIVSPVPRL